MSKQATRILMVSPNGEVTFVTVPVERRSSISRKLLGEIVRKTQFSRS